MMHRMTLEEARKLPLWRRPVTLLLVMAAAMPFAFATWIALLNNFVIEAANFDGVDIGWLQTVREIPGFFAVGVIVIIVFIREQHLAIISLIALGAATAVTAWFPTFQGLLWTTFIGSLGFHYYETVKQSLTLQWLDKEDAPKIIGWLVAAGSVSSLIVYSVLVIGWREYGWSYNLVYLIGGGVTVTMAIFCQLAYPQIDAPAVQNKTMVLRKRYWLYYALQFMSGARRQIFVVFAAFMMVEHFGMDVHELTALFLINFVANIIFAPIMGHVIHRFGERNALAFEYTGLVLVFLAYGGIYWFGWGIALAMALYVIDHLFFALAFAMQTYFQKIADPADIAPTAAVAFTINHIAAVFLPAALGYLWITSPDAVFILAALMAGISLALALMIPRHPQPGQETVFSARTPVLQSAE